MELTPPAFRNANRLNIGIISDTHGLLRPEALKSLSGSDVILHAGDVGKESILDELETMAPVFTVRGNVDYEYWCGRLPDQLTLTLGGLTVYMIHDLAHFNQVDSENADLVVYGHSHKPETYELKGTTFLNPGSAGPRRFTLPVTLATLQWETGQKILEPKLIRLIN